MSRANHSADKPVDLSWFPPHSQNLLKASHPDLPQLATPLTPPSQSVIDSSVSSLPQSVTSTRTPRSIRAVNYDSQANTTQQPAYRSAAVHSLPPPPPTAPSSQGPQSNAGGLPRPQRMVKPDTRPSPTTSQPQPQASHPPLSQTPYQVPYGAPMGVSSIPPTKRSPGMVTPSPAPAHASPTYPDSHSQALPFQNQPPNQTQSTPLPRGSQVNNNGKGIAPSLLTHSPHSAPHPPSSPSYPSRSASAANTPTIRPQAPPTFANTPLPQPPKSRPQPQSYPPQAYPPQAYPPQAMPIPISPSPLQYVRPHLNAPHVQVGPGRMSPVVEPHVVSPRLEPVPLQHVPIHQFIPGTPHTVPRQRVYEEHIVERHHIHEKIVEVPEIQIQEKIIEYPQLNIEEKIIEVPRIHIQDRIIQIPKDVVVEKIVAVPEYEVRLQHHEKTIEIPQVAEQIVIKEIEVPPIVEVPTPQIVKIQVPIEIERNIPFPVEVVAQFPYKQVKKVKVKEKEVPLPIYVPRFIETPMIAEEMQDEQFKQAVELGDKLATLGRQEHVLQQQLQDMLPLAEPIGRIMTGAPGTAYAPPPPHLASKQVLSGDNLFFPPRASNQLALPPPPGRPQPHTLAYPELVAHGHPHMHHMPHPHYHFLPPPHMHHTHPHHTHAFPPPHAYHPYHLPPPMSAHFYHHQPHQLMYDSSPPPHNFMIPGAYPADGVTFTPTGRVKKGSRSPSAFGW
eukprot:GHVN01013519.1.p1 GENE.GHVN01013519.1~~GHVN01013519.1.p1  ORF type:complete len:727 (+),score=137.18 GHVN01013519.1:81-2261(+)